MLMMSMPLSYSTLLMCLFLLWSSLAPSYAMDPRGQWEQGAADPDKEPIFRKHARGTDEASPPPSTTSKAKKSPGKPCIIDGQYLIFKKPKTSHSPAAAAPHEADIEDAIAALQPINDIYTQINSYQATLESLKNSHSAFIDRGIEYHKQIVSLVQGCNNHLITIKKLWRSYKKIYTTDPLMLKDAAWRDFKKNYKKIKNFITHDHKKLKQKNASLKLRAMKKIETLGLLHPTHLIVSDPDHSGAPVADPSLDPCSPLLQVALHSPLSESTCFIPPNPSGLLSPLSQLNASPTLPEPTSPILHDFSDLDALELWLMGYSSNSFDVPEADAFYITPDS